MEQINDLKQKLDTLSKPEADSSSVIENPDQPTADVTYNQSIPPTPKNKRTPTVEEILDEKYQDWLHRIKNGEILSNRTTAKWFLIPMKKDP